MSAGLAPASSDRAVGGLAAVPPVGWAEEEDPGMGRDTSSMVKTLWLRLESMLSFVAAFCRFAAPCRTRLMPATGDTGPEASLRHLEWTSRDTPLPALSETHLSIDDVGPT
jgi:hypothetical protein